VTIVHHPDDATLLSYAGGSLDEVFTTLIAAHLASCPACRRRVRALEAVGASLLERDTNTVLSPGATARLMQRLDRENTPVAQDAPAAATTDSVLARLIGGSLDDIRWKRVAPGVATHRLPVSPGSKGSLLLLKIASGKKVPEHGHGGMEMTLILEGSYRDELGRFGPGDVADLDEHVEHQPVVDSHIPCICLVATEQPTRFKGFFSRLLQPLVGI
jgi:putative transcriptional regulator